MAQESPNPWLAPALATLVPYDPGFTQVDVLLSANENSFGVPEDVRAAMQRATEGIALNRYPDPMANELRDAIAAWHGVSRGNVVVGNGGDEIIFNLLLAFGGAGRTLIDCPPTFSIYGLYAQITGTNVMKVPRNADSFELDTDAIDKAAAQANIIMITSPNNPTGNLADLAWVDRLASSTKALIVMDEAYVEFADEGASSVALLRKHDNVCILRTFSKAFGLAGVRCGYLLAPQAVVDGMSAVRQPYSVDVCAQAIARVAVERREAFIPAIETIRAQRELMIEGLNAIEGVRVWPSAANFILVRLPNAHEAHLRLRDEHSILVRDFSRTPGLDNCLRITVGTPEENRRVLDAMEALA